MMDLSEHQIDIESSLGRLSSLPQELRDVIAQHTVSSYIPNQMREHVFNHRLVSKAFSQLFQKHVFHYYQSKNDTLKFDHIIEGFMAARSRLPMPATDEYPLNTIRILHLQSWCNRELMERSLTQLTKRYEKDHRQSLSNVHTLILGAFDKGTSTYMDAFVNALERSLQHPERTKDIVKTLLTLLTVGDNRKTKISVIVDMKVNGIYSSLKHDSMWRFPNLVLDALQESDKVSSITLTGHMLEEGHSLRRFNDSLNSKTLTHVLPQPFWAATFDWLFSYEQPTDQADLLVKRGDFVFLQPDNDPDGLVKYLHEELTKKYKAQRERAPRYEVSFRLPDYETVPKQRTNGAYSPRLDGNVELYTWTDDGSCPPNTNWKSYNLQWP